ncbi:MAG: hypothetical protein KDJ22_18275, partial [Candidatus Competibacteraceae bacterium]|nr:hypothetical protein [Candidatus Competibacteraceae bacterium]
MMRENQSVFDSDSVRNYSNYQPRPGVCGIGDAVAPADLQAGGLLHPVSPEYFNLFNKEAVHVCSQQPAGLART